MQINHPIIYIVFISLTVSGLDSGGKCPPGYTYHTSKDGLNDTSCLACDQCSTALLDYLYELNLNLRHANDTIDPKNLSEKISSRLVEMESTLNEHSIGLQASQNNLNNAKASFNSSTDDILSLITQLEHEAEELENVLRESKFVESTLELTGKILDHLHQKVVREIDHDKITDVTLTAMLDMRQSIELLHNKIVGIRSQTNQHANLTNCVRTTPVHL